ncbi:citrate lyase holo-[acyl-carrier protein] synthase [Clostridium estertheticum]|uniref:citrate lyase holo-[acyl-carrier protein] synthase n=1 Tax=Clostridium estertheticum TaxID=238834 RepID=UPI001CF259C5|nr:citrate lyase holo-[acyl-carrier protein] synthase [Clostridium estertheticum]MCB2308632.1 citrate lyase holo-[acyl-carrier protein] synthase [Clostridium estertheticum]MCB2344601.1 citrate lyase holo-[acyl-carrier protein] synthase [Clostridium estertheticum]WAG45583.1 citrate lyase holo-[acyl-carrier protein] synthase [Clostridium estertheticum]
MYTAEDIMLAREIRIKYQEELVKQYKIPLLVIRVNYPGINKNNYYSHEITRIMYKIICELFSNSIIFKRIITTAEGLIVIMCINNEARDIKLITLNLEDNHILGRCVDLDVYDEKGRSISRRDFGLEMRKCYICDDIAHICVRSKKHSLEEVEGFIKSKFSEYTKKFATI